MNTENIQVIYNPTVQPTTPMQKITSGPTPIYTAEMPNDSVKKPDSFNIILIAIMFLVTIAIIYWIRKLKN
jgi:hypothetical protein